MKKRLISLIMILALLPIWFAPSPALASHQFLWWDDIGSVRHPQFTTGTDIVIMNGQMEFVQLCEIDGVNDYLWPATDVYIMASGNITVGTELEDVNGIPNTIISPTSFGLFIDETIGNATNLEDGHYMVIYDECQDGSLDPGDFVYPDAFEVVTAQTSVPEISLLNQLKQRAAEVAKKYLDDLGEKIDEWFKNNGKPPSNNPIAKWLYGRTDIPFTNRPEVIVRIQIINLAKHYLGIVADPPDPNFQQVTPLAERVTIDTPRDDPVLLAAAAVGNEASTEAAIAEALLHALERYQGAQQAGNGKWALIHARAIRDYANILSAQLAKSNQALDQLDAELVADTTNVDANAAEAQAFIDRVRSSSFTSDELREASNLGLTSADIAAFQAELLALDFSNFSEASLRDTIVAVRASNMNLDSALAQFAINMHSVIVTLENDPLTPDNAPTTNAGGPYTGVEGSILTLAGSATSPTPITTYEWDLDGDGSFDDETGASPSFTYEMPFHGLIGLRVTNQMSASNVAYTRVDIQDANRRPEITGFAPIEDPVIMEVGESQLFAVAATDPDADTIGFAWFVDGASADGSDTFSYDATLAAIGLHHIEVEAQDANPLGGIARRGWAVAVVGADADADGWRQNTDCDDGNAAVNPAMPEIIGNGLNDDCDAATPDLGSPPAASFTFSTSPGIVGEPIQFTDTSTDPNSPINTWAWDFDNNGTVDSTQQNPTHTFVAGGTSTVVLTVTDPQGNTNSASSSIVITARPVAAFSFTPAQPLTGTPTQFTDGSADDGTIVVWSWDFGDGGTSSLQSPTHTYASAGAFEVTLTVTDDAGASQTTSRTLSLLAAPTAAFNVSKGLNTADLDLGATITSFSSRAGLSTAVRPENAIDSNPATGWVTASGQTANQWIKVQLIGSGLYVVDHVILRGSINTVGLKDFQIRVSTTGTADADFATVFAGTVPQDSLDHTFSFPPVHARHVQLFAVNNYGSTVSTNVYNFQVRMRDYEGGIVSLREGPAAAVVAFSSQFNALSGPELILDGTGTAWRSASGQAANQFVTVRLGGAKTYRVDRVRLQSPGGTFTAEGVKDFEIRVSNTTADAGAFATAFSGTRANDTNLQEFSFAPVDAKYVQLFVKNNYGSTCCVQLATFQVITTDGANAAQSSGVGAFILASSSQATTGTGPENTIDFSTASIWQTANNQTTNQWFKLRLLQGAPYLIDRVKLQGHNTLNSPKDFELRVSNATTADADFQTIYSGRLPQGGFPYWISLPPTQARYVQLYILNNYGGTAINVTDFEVYSPQLGSPTVPFDDFSIAANGSITSWSWGFGDGQTSSERHPVHIYAAPGTYLVTLTVVDSSGVVSTTSMAYTAQSAVPADFTWVPVTPDERQGVAFTDASGSGVLAWQWLFSEGTTATTQNRNITFFDNGVYTATLTTLDYQFLTSTRSHSLTVLNVPPTVNVGADRTWTASQELTFSPSITDPGPNDAPTCVWEFGDGSPPSTDCDFSHSYTGIGINDPARVYTASLTVTDKDGGVASDSLVITVQSGRPGLPAGGVLFYTRWSGTPNVKKVTFGYDGVYGFTLDTPAVVATVNGADGLAFAPDGDLLVGGQGDRVHKVDPQTGASQTVTAGGTSSFHVAVDPSGQIVWSGGVPGPLAEVPLNPFANGTRRTLTGDDTTITSIAFDQAGNAFYTRSVPQGNGSFGTINLTNFTTKRLIQNLPAAHGMAYDSFTGHLMLFGANHITQIDPVTKAIVADRSFGDADFDQGTVDGEGHLYVASDEGRLLFMDYTESGNISDTRNFVALVFLDTNLDDVAPLSGPGSDPLAALELTPASAVYTLGASHVATARATTASGNPVADLPVTFAVSGSNSAGGTATTNASGVATFSYSGSAAGEDTISASAGGLNSAIAYVQWNSLNVAPTAAGQQVTVDEDTPTSIALGANDADGNELTFVIVTPPAHGSLTGTAPNLTYMPAANYNGADSFTFRANDGIIDSNVATVAIAVTPVNDAPTATADDYHIDEDSSLTVPALGVLINDSDVEGDHLAVILVASTSSGNLTLYADGSFSYTPAENFAGIDHFTYRASDGLAESSDTVATITAEPLNDAPVVSNDSYTTPEDTVLTIPAAGVLANDSDVEGDTLRATQIEAPVHGSLTFNADGSFSYTPNSNYTGLDSFSYLASDGQLNSTIATVNLTISAVNDAPLAQDDSYSTNEDTPLSITTPGVLANDSDVDGDALSTLSVSGPAHGTLTLYSNGAFVYVPNANYSGADSFSYQASDGSASSATTTVRIMISAVNDAPSAADNSYSTAEDTTLSVPAAGVLTNDIDLEGDPLTASIVDQPGHGSLMFHADGSFSYMPDADYSGADSFSYQANDGLADSNVATVNLTISAVNDLPLTQDDSYATDEDTTLTMSQPGVLANDTDVDGDTLSVLSVSTTQHGNLTLYANGAFSYTPDADYIGSDSFSYRASDGTATSTTTSVTIVIGGVNDAPVAVADSYTTVEDMTLSVPAAGVLANDTDVDGDMLIATVVTQPNHGSLALSANGAFTYIPDADYAGSDSFSYQASDSKLDSAVTMVNLIITAVNDAPTAQDDSYSTSEDTTLIVTAPGVLANDSDAEGSVLTASLVSGPAHGTLTLNANGSFNYTPAANYTGSDSFSYEVSDSVLSSTPTTVNLVVNTVDDAPIALADSYSTHEDIALTVVAPGVLANDVDAEGSALTASLVSSPAHGTLILNTNGSFNYTPAVNYHGPDSFSYQASDSQGTSNVAIVTISVIAVNDAPVCTNASASPSSLWPVNHKWVSISLDGCTDVEGDAITLQVTSIFQDEPVNEVGSGNTSPDGQGVGTATPQVRAERAGGSDGRVYHIRFTASDTNGGQSSSEVLVRVPHSNGGVAIDGGALYDSTIN